MPHINRVTPETSVTQATGWKAPIRRLSERRFRANYGSRRGRHSGAGAAHRRDRHRARRRRLSPDVWLQTAAHATLSRAEPARGGLFEMAIGKGMGPLSGELTEDGIWRLINYLRTFDDLGPR